MSSAIRCVVVTPEKTVLDRTADYVVAPLSDGEKGVDKNHSPMIARLGHGELRLREGATTDRYYVEAGFLQIADNVVTLLTDRMVSAADIDRADVQQQLDDAGGRSPADEIEAAQKEAAVSKAREMLRIASKG